MNEVIYYVDRPSPGLETEGIRAVQQALQRYNSKKTVDNIRNLFTTIEQYQFMLANPKFGDIVAQRLKELCQEVEKPINTPALRDHRSELRGVLLHYRELLSAPRRFHDECYQPELQLRSIRWDE